MWSPFRSILLVLLSSAAIFAQETASPTPGPSASPTPAEAPSPVPEATPTPAPSPAVDVIPMEGGASPAAGAPLETQDIAPVPPLDQAMPDDAFTQPNSVIPDEAPPAVGQALDNAQEKARLQNIRYKEVRIQVDKDPQVASLLKQSVDAKTPEDKRAALREYYRLLFKKIAAIDKSLEKKCQNLEDAYIRRLAQRRLEPTIPLNPPPTPEPLN